MVQAQEICREDVFFLRINRERTTSMLCMVDTSVNQGNSIKLLRHNASGTGWLNSWAVTEAEDF